MAVTTKISVAMGDDELRRARIAAEHEGVSLSAYITGAVRDRLEERRRLDAARAVLSTFAPDDFPTPAEQRDLVALWMHPRSAVTVPTRRRKRRA